MNKKLIVFVVLILLIIAGGVFWQQSGKEATEKEEGNPVHVEKTSAKITGRYIEPPEAIGKIELTHALIKGFGESRIQYYQAPEIKITIKNISNEIVKIYPSETIFPKYNQFYLEIISKDREGKILEKGPPKEGLSGAISPLTLQPKEIIILDGVQLFSSDETKGYEVILGYKKIPGVSGVYIENPDLSELTEKLSVSHHYEKKYDEMDDFYRLSIMGEVKNISKERIKFSGKNELILKIVFKDSTGNTIKSQEDTIIPWGTYLEPGVIGLLNSFDFSLPSGKEDEIKTYELTLVVREDKF